MTFTNIFKNGLWQCTVCFSLTRDFLSSCDRLQLSQYKHHVCLCSFQVFTNLHRRCKGGHVSPKRKFGEPGPPHFKPVH